MKYFRYHAARATILLGGMVLALFSGSGALYADSAAAASGSANEPVLEIHIANNGLTFIQDATVTKLDGNSMTIASAWGSQVFSWTVQTTMNTNFFKPGGEKAAISDIKVGDLVSITGKLDTNATHPTINATAVREVMPPPPSVVNLAPDSANVASARASAPQAAPTAPVGASPGFALALALWLVASTASLALVLKRAAVARAFARFAQARRVRFQ